MTVTPSPLDPPGSHGEFQWGGVAGTHWWIAPGANLAGVVMTQRQMAFWHPFWFEFKRLVHQAVLRPSQFRACGRRPSRGLTEPT